MLVIENKEIIHPSQFITYNFTLICGAFNYSLLGEKARTISV